jgi:hypothetical protein
MTFQQPSHSARSARLKVAIGELPHHSSPSFFATWQWREKEVAVSTVIDFSHRDNCDRYHLWDRFERADLFAP